MSRHDKLLAKVTATPTPSNIKWAELTRLLEGLGYEMQKNSGSRRKFYNKKHNHLINLHEPHPNPEVDRGAIADVVESLRLKQII